MPLGFQEIKALGCALFGFSLPRAGAFTVAKSVSSGCAKVWLPGFSISGLFKLWELVMDREAWRAAVLRVAKTRTELLN